jgi:tetratricopeptide (TPR) repeat protein
MDDIRSSTASPKTNHWFEIPTLEHLSLMAIHYRRVLFGLVVAITFLYVQGRFAEMDNRLFQPSVHGIQGLFQYQMGRYGPAAVAYRADLRNGGWKEWQNGDEAYAALLRGNLSEAARLADLRLTKQPNDAEAWLTQGEIALEEGNIRRASDAFDHAAALDGTHFDALLLSAVAHSRSGDMNKAIDRLGHALRYNYAGHRITAYLWGLQTAGEIRQDSPDGLRWALLAHYYRYLRIFDLSNASWARDAATRAIESGSRLDDAYITLGILEEKTGNYDAALPYFLKAVETNPRNPEAYRRAANMYRHRGSDLLNEYKMWQGADAASPLDVFYRDSLAAFLTERFGDYPQALDLVREALDQQPQNTDLLERAGNLYQRLGKHEDAIRLFRDLLALQPRSPNILDSIGYSLVSLEHYDDAIGSFQNALAINPRRPQSHSGLGAVYARQGRYADSIHEYETALEIGGDDINTRAFLCTQYWATNRYQDAEACLKHVLRHDPHNKSAIQIYPYVTKGLEYGKHER